MNFDSTHIAIRERGFAEIMDLALHVTRAHAGPLLLALVAGVAPWAVINALLFAEATRDVEAEAVSAYLFLMTMFIVVQLPLATAPITLYLGQVTFADRVDYRRIVRDYFRCLPQMFISQGMFRAVLALPVIGLLIPYLSWPYLSELILLERNPMFPGKAKRLTTRRRSRHLHGGAGGELFARAIASAAAALLMTIALAGGLYMFAVQLFAVEAGQTVVLMVIIPLAMWLVAGFFAVVRFLAYLDLRIRREGWEVELKMRAEAERLARVA